MLLLLGLVVYCLLGSGLCRPLDLMVYSQYGSSRSPGLEWLTRLGSEVACAVALATLVWLVLRRTSEARRYLLLMATQHVLTHGSKWLFHTQRPLRPGMVGGYAYPSGHTVMAVCVYGFLAERSTGCFRGLLLSLPWLVAASRVALGHHWLSDVMGALLLGWMCLCLTKSLPKPP